MTPQDDATQNRHQVALHYAARTMEIRSNIVKKVLYRDIGSAIAMRKSEACFDIGENVSRNT